MEQKIKLKPKQLAVLTQIQQKKSQLSSMFQDLNTQETTILELVLEDANITDAVSGVKLSEDGFLTFEVNQPNDTEKPKKKVKTVKSE